MLSGFEKVMLGCVTGVVAIGMVLIMVLPPVIEGPMFARCTQAALDALARADPRDRHAPATVIAFVEQWEKQDLAFETARLVMRNSGCNGPPELSINRLFEALGVSFWWRVRFSHDDIVALYVSQASLGYERTGFSAASRSFFGRGLDALSSFEVICLALKPHVAPVSPSECYERYAVQPGQAEHDDADR